MLTLMCCLVVYWPFLGHSGLSQSEGHRAIPGWEMLKNGDWLVTRMFEQVYLRKPPGMPWAVALFSMVLGETEFAARAVSAASTTLSALLLCLVGCRWFGPLAGAIAGLGLALMPTLWYPGRSSEIEALHNLFVLGSMLGILSLGLSQHRPRVAALIAIATGIAITGMILSKGPAGVPCVAGAVLAVRLTRRNWGGLASPGILLTSLIPVVVVGVFTYFALQRFESLQEPAILESPGHFLWNLSNLSKIVSLPFMALLVAFPAGIGLVCAYGGAPLDHQREQYARGVIFACLIALLIFACAGVSNTRYAKPAMLIMPLGWGIVLTRFREGLSQDRWSSTARKTTRYVVISVVVLIFVAWGYSYWLEKRRDTRTGGRPLGHALAELVDDGTEIWAFEMIDQRPDLLYYTRQRALELGKQVRVRWMPLPDALSGPRETLASRPLLPPSGSYLMVRDDERPRDQYMSEMDTYAKKGLLNGLGEPIFVGKVHKFSFRVFKVP